ncbi:MAG: tripartite tricarboxylate transporter TctB family protein [Treponema sp.]|nr:tripartite tricarboxylate transporter TctB family protein [Treponema sp.]
MNERRKINNDVFIGIILTALSVFFFMEAQGLHPMAARFPTIVFGVFIGMSVLLIILGIRKTLKPQLALASDFLLNIRVIRTPVVVFGIITGYMVLMNFTGFFISTAVFVPVFMVFYGVKRIRTIALTNIILILFVYVVFVRVLRLPMP